MRALVSNAINYANPLAVLVSGKQKIVQESCVHFQLYYTTGLSFSVRVPKCINTTSSEGLLLQITNGLGDAWHKIWLPLILIGNQCDVQLQFEVIYDYLYRIGAKTAVKDVLLSEGKCTHGMSLYVCNSFAITFLIFLCII